MVADRPLLEVESRFLGPCMLQNMFKGKVTHGNRGGLLQARSTERAFRFLRWNSNSRDSVGVSPTSRMDSLQVP